MIYPADLKIYKVPGFYNPSEARNYELVFRPDIWQSGTIYTKPEENEGKLVIPSVFTGFYYEVDNPGISGDTEPTWITQPGEITIDGTTGLVWIARLYNLLPLDENIIDVQYQASHDIILEQTSNTTTSCQFMIPALTTEAVDEGWFEIIIIAVKDNNEQEQKRLMFRTGALA